MSAADYCRARTESFLEDHLARRRQDLPPATQTLLDSVKHSCLGGGKRFRPMVCYLAARALECSEERVWPYAAAIEMVHSYSLIHDDLPCMDNDDWRRGRPTNHRVFGEATALLAGDALLTEAFHVLGVYYAEVPEVGLSLVRLLSEAAGLTGMVAGQVWDLSLAASDKPGREDLISLHALKTGALIRASVLGVAQIARADDVKKRAMGEFGRLLGLAFQVADDLLDFHPEKQETAGLPRALGVAQTRELLEELTTDALRAISIFGSGAEGLRELVEFNRARKN